MKKRYIFVSIIILLLVGGFVSSYYFGSCPLDDEGSGICTGPCTAFIDLNEDGICDRSQGNTQTDIIKVELTSTPAANTDQLPSSTPVATDQTLEEEPAAPATATSAPTPTATSQPETDCPFGLVNDPYPGECGRYVDQNENDICDHSEP